MLNLQDLYEISSPIPPAQTFLVGGAVRDALLGIQSKDRDWVVVGTSPEEMLDCGYEQVGTDFPVFLHPQNKEEFALARTERKSGLGYKGFSCDTSKTVTLEEDLERRDLTINAMAYAPSSGLIDPYMGKEDLVTRTLRHVSKAFSEDPLRVLRVARFAARLANLNFTIANETIDLMKDMAESGELAELTPERVWQETTSALAEDASWVYFEVLRDCHALEKIMPELDALFGIPQPKKFHPEIDCGIHALLSLKMATENKTNVSVRFASLIHDLGKAMTPKASWPKHHGHERLGLKPIKALCDRLRVDKKTKRLSLLSSEYHTHIHRAFELRPDTILKVIKACDAFRNQTQFEEVLLVAQFDAQGRTGLESTPYPQAQFFRDAFAVVRSLKIDYQSLQSKGLTGKSLGEEIDRIRIESIASWKSQQANDNQI